MKYEFSYFSEEHDDWLGLDPDSKRHILGIPVSNPRVDYIETYWLNNEQYDDFVTNQNMAAEFADACRRREHDDLLRTGQADTGTPNRPAVAGCVASGWKRQQPRWNGRRRPRRERW